MNQNRSGHNNSVWRSFTTLVVLLSGMPFFIACEQAPIELTRTDRRQVDSLFQQEKNAIDREVDSLCRKWAAEKSQGFKDSLMERRWAEIRQILESDE